MAHMDIKGRVEGANLEIKGLICRFGGSLGRVGGLLENGDLVAHEKD